jgi:hypothetical protein
MNEEEKKKAISEYMKEIGKRGGEKTKLKGSEHFKWVRSQRKTKKTK